MFLGHYGLAFAAKRAAPETSLGTLTLAGNLADTVWPILLLLGVEQVRIAPGWMTTSPLDFVSYPYSHSLLTQALAGLAFGLLVWAIRRDARAAVVTGLLVVSHWFLDVPFHRPDLPVWPGGPKVGFSLWDSALVTYGSEALLFGVGVWLYASQTKAKDRTGSVALWALVVFLAAVYVASALGPPPPNSSAVAWTTLALWLLVPWTYFIDRHRSLRALSG
jgi:hypothetical protein